MNKSSILVAGVMAASVIGPITAFGAGTTAEVYNCEYLNVRSGPGSTHKIIGVANAGAKVQVISKTGNWSLVEVNNKRGYVSSQYLRAAQSGAQASNNSGYISKTSGLFKQPGKGKVAEITPQKVQIIQKRADGWNLIKSWKGNLWVKDGALHERTYLSKKTGIFKQPGQYKSGVLTPQYVEVLETKSNGWMRVNTWRGAMWVKNGVLNDTPYITYESGLYTSPGSGKVGSIKPQRVIAVERRTDGWIRIQTWKGNLWTKDGFNRGGVPKKAVAVKAPVSSKAVLSRPTTSGTRVTSNFGARWGTTHYGKDYAGPGNQKILAAAAGTVSRSYVHPSWGEVIFIKHTINGKKYETIYAHLRKGSRAVKVGQKVNAGAFIGWMGSTGHSTGQHLHFEVHPGGYLSPSRSAVDPTPYIK